MEEDIKIVKEIKKEFITKMKKDITHNDNQIRYRNIQALQNILNELDRLKKENEELSYIISEIEQYTLDEQINEESINYNKFIEIQNMAFDRVYNKLQELLNKGE